MGHDQSARWGHTRPTHSRRRRFTGVRAISFDVGGTLLEPWPSVGHVYAEVARRHGVPQATPELLNHRFQAAWTRRSQPHHTRAQWRELVDEVFAGLAWEPPSRTFFPELYDRFSTAGAWRVFEDVRPTLDFLKRLRVPMAVVSNWDERLRPLLSVFNLEAYFSVILISCEMGAAKPSPFIFQQAARQLCLPPESVLHVGDSEQDDLEGARAAGLQAIQIDRSRVGKSEERIRSLEELKQPLHI